MSELLKVNVNEHVEKKSNLSYLSWAWAWAEVLKHDPGATWEPVMYGNSVLMSLPDQTAFVGVEVTIKNVTRQCVLPVMDHRNKAIPNPNAFDTNKNLMRCLAKAIAMHGLGLYIYAGEDLPEGETGDWVEEFVLKIESAETVEELRAVNGEAVKRCKETKDTSAYERVRKATNDARSRLGV